MVYVLFVFIQSRKALHMICIATNSFAQYSQLKNCYIAYKHHTMNEVHISSLKS